MSPPLPRVEVACRICYQIEGKVKNYVRSRFYIEAYEKLTEYKFEELPYFTKFCPMCACLLRKLDKFQRQCVNSHFHLTQNTDGKEITPRLIRYMQRLYVRPVNLYVWEQKSATVVDSVHSPKKFTPIPKQFYDIGVSHMSVPQNPEDKWHCRPTPHNDVFCNEYPDSDEERSRMRDGDASLAEIERMFPADEEMDDVMQEPIPLESVNDTVIKLDQDNMTLQQIKDMQAGEMETEDDVPRGNKRKRSSKKTENHSPTKSETETDSVRAKRQKSNQDLENHFTITTFNTEEEQVQEFLRRKETDAYLEGAYKCELCLKSFKEQKWMDTHVKKHEPSAGSYICEICKIRCRTPKLFRTHRDANHTTKFLCHRCDYYTFSKAQALKHHGWHEGVEHCCQHCGATFRKHTTYMGHLRRAHPSSYICGVCARSFVSAYGLNLHVKAVHKDISKLGKDSTKCEECDVTFVSHKMYIRHLLITDKHKDMAGDILGCRKCGEQFASKGEMENHTHYKERKYVRKTEAPVRSIKCDECDQVFSHPNGVYQHYLREHPDKPYKFAIQRHYLCEQCGRTFKSPGLLQQHSLTHQGLRPPQPKKPQGRNSCRVCGKTYSKLSGLFRHKLTHLGVRRHKCHICEKAFTDTSNLKQHVQGVHLNIRRIRKR